MSTPVSGAVLKKGIPEKTFGWNKYSFTLRAGKAVLQVLVEQDKTTLYSKNGETVQLRLNGRAVTVTAEPYIYTKEA